MTLNCNFYVFFPSVCGHWAVTTAGTAPPAGEIKAARPIPS